MKSNSAILSKRIESLFEQNGYQQLNPPLSKSLNGQTIAIFADMSGFTNLTQSYAAEGDNGTLKLAHHINNYMDLIISIILKHNGDIIRMVGDCLICVFNHNINDNNNNNNSNNNNMKSTMSELRCAMECCHVIQTTCGEYTCENKSKVKIKCGVGIGSCDIWAVGTKDDWQYLVKGDAVEQCYQCERESLAGGIVISSQCYKLIEENKKEYFDDEFKFTFEATKNSEYNTYQMIRGPKGKKIKLGKATIIKDKKLQLNKKKAKEELEKRIKELEINLKDLSILFISMSNIDVVTNLSLHEIDQRLKAMQNVVEKYNGKTVKMVLDDFGMALIVLFGLNSNKNENYDESKDNSNSNSNSNHTEDAVMAALALTDIDRELHIGVGTGMVYYGRLGGEERYEYGPLGDRMNLVARVMSLAKKHGNKGSIYCDDSVYERCGNLQQKSALESLGETWVKGKQEPVHLYGFNGDVLQESIEENCDKLRKDIKIANGLLNYCNKYGISDKLNTVINDMVKNKEVINDSLLLFSHLVDKEKIMDSIESITNKVLLKSGSSSDEKNEMYRIWYEECILESNIFAMPGGKKSKIKTKSKTKNDEGLCFNRIMNQLLNKELEKHKKFVKTEMKKLVKQDEKSWQQLVNIKNENFALNNAIQQNTCKIMVSSNSNTIDSKSEQVVDCMSVDKGGIDVKYKKYELLQDLDTGFNSGQSYDSNCIGTQLIIMANKINLQFQNDCKNIFKNEIGIKLGINCHFKDAPIKTLARTQMKGSTDYAYAAWPNTTHVIDLVRCSVHLQTLKELCMVFNQFCEIVEQRHQQQVMIQMEQEQEQKLTQKQKQKLQISGKEEEETKVDVVNTGNVGGGAMRGNNDWCVLKILRIKNGFFGKDDKNGGGEEVDGYCDLKCNVLVESKGVRLIGEIQFLLDVMLKLKTMGHKVYKFTRKEEYYNGTFNTLTYNQPFIKNIDNKLRKIITQQDFNKLKKLLLFLTNDQDRNYVKNNKQKLIDQMKLNKSRPWNKGIRLLSNVHFEIL